MKRIDVIFPAYINATIGPTGTLRRLIRDKDKLKLRGYVLEVFTGDLLMNHDVSNENSTYDFTKGLSRRSKIKEFIKKSRILSVLFMLREQYRHKKLVNYYISLDRKADIVVFHELNCCYYYLKLRKILNKTVLFFHSDGKRWEMLYKAYPKLKGSIFMKFMNKHYNYTISNLDKYVFIAKNGQTNFLEENKQINIEQTAFFHNGIDDIKISKSDKNYDYKYRLVCTGSVCTRKGQYIVINAINKLPKDILANFHFTLLGDGNDLPSLKEFVAKNNLSANISFIGNVPNEKINEYLIDSNIFILMSNNEGLPISIIEAMRANLPIISTKIAGIPELVDSRNGVLINPSIEQLVEIFLNMDKYNWNKMGNESRERFVSEFSFDKMRNSYCDMLDSLL